MEVQVTGLEKKIDNLQISDVFPVKSEVTGKPSEPQQPTSDKASDKNLIKPQSKSIDKPTAPVDKPTEHSKPVDKSVPVEKQPADGKASQPARPAASANEQLKASPAQPVITSVQPSTPTQAQQPTAGAVRSSSTSNEAKRSSLDGAQSKSANEKISYDLDFLKNLQFIGSSNQRPNFDVRQQVEIILPEARTKNDQYNNDMFDPGFGPMGRPGPVSIARHSAALLVSSSSSS